MSNEQYPRGKIHPRDQGQTQMAVAVKDGTVIIAFQKPMAWIGLGYDEAKALGEAPLRKAEEIRQ